MTGAEPFWLPASTDIGVLLIHGFTGSPAELRGLGQHLQDSGVSALGVRLPGHGTTIEDLNHFGRQSWLREAHQGLEQLSHHCQTVILCGMSMGGTIALNLAARHAWNPQVVGVVAMAAPVRLIDHRYRASELKGLLRRWRDWGMPDIKDRAQWKKHIGYKLAPLSSTIQLIRLVHETCDLLPEVRQPLLVIQSQQDHTVPAINVHWLLDRVGSVDRQVLWLEDSHHVITVDVEAEKVARRVLEFTRHLQASPQ